MLGLPVGVKELSALVDAVSELAVDAFALVAAQVAPPIMTA